MKFFHFISILLINTLTNTFAQSSQLKKVDSINVLYGTILRDYWSECIQDRFFFEDKGIVKVIVYQDTLGNNCLNVSALIDDRFQDNPTDSYTFINSDLYLIYKGDSNGNELKSNKKVAKKLKKLVGDRVYINPPKIIRWVEITDINGNPKKVISRNISFGNSRNETTYIFDKAGTFTKLKSL